jgi:DNA-binding NtrC family response regulator
MKSKDEPAEVRTDVVKGAPARRRDMAYRLTVLEGRDVGATLSLEPTSPTGLLVGQGPACALRLTDPTTSRRHLSVDLHSLGARICDLGSTNGTRVNGLRIEAAILTGGELVQLGSTTIRVEAIDAGAATLPGGVRFGRLLGSSARMRRLYPLLARLAQSDIPLVIEGEAGTGKELLAEALHEEGPRRAKPFLAFDCSGSPSSVCLPALFGTSSEPGLLEQASGGTIALLSVAELPTEAQTRLARFLDRGEVRLEGPNAIKSSARVIATSRVNLDLEVQEKRFDEDLFFRLGVGRVELPPLRERDDDVDLLARAFWDRVAPGQPFPKTFGDGLKGNRWTGNVRELANLVTRRAVEGALYEATASQNVVPAADGLVDRLLALNLPLLEGRARLIEEYDRRYIEKVLAQHNGNVSRAAAASGIARRYFHMLIAKRRPQPPR